VNRKLSEQMRFSSLCLIDQLVTLFFINENIIALVFLSTEGCTIAYFEKTSHAMGRYFLTAGFANPSEKTVYTGAFAYRNAAFLGSSFSCLDR